MEMKVEKSKMMGNLREQPALQITKEQILLKMWNISNIRVA
jgi:hypothetical protein